MVVRYAVAAGNWSNPATWDGGTLPAPEDEVYANAKTVTIDQASVTVTALRTVSLASPVIAGGGFFNIVVECVLTISSGIAAGDSSTSPMISCVAGSSPVTIIAPTITAGATAGQRVGISQPGKVTIIGSLVGGTASSGAHAVYSAMSTSVDLLIQGDVTSGTGSSSYTLYLTTTASTRLMKVSIEGTLRTGGGGQAAYFNGYEHGSTFTFRDIVGGAKSVVYFPSTSLGRITVNVTGTISGGTSMNQNAITAHGDITVNDVVGGTSTGAFGLEINNSNTLNRLTILGASSGYSGSSGCSAIYCAAPTEIYGNVQGGSGVAGSPGLEISPTADCIYRGTATAITREAILSAGILYFSGELVSGTKGQTPVVGNICAIPGEPIVWVVPTDTDFPTAIGPVVSLTQKGSNGVDPQDVREGVLYGEPAAPNIGSLRVPSKEAVAAGVPVGNEVGTAALNPTDVGKVITSQFNAVK